MVLIGTRNVSKAAGCVPTDASNYPSSAHNRENQAKALQTDAIKSQTKQSDSTFSNRRVTAIQQPKSGNLQLFTRQAITPHMHAIARQITQHGSL
jgi:hypothetical protein